MSRYIKDSAGKLVKFADKFLKMANHIYNEGIYYLRVKAGGGTVTDREMVEDIYKVYEENNMLDNIRVGVLAQAGGVQRTSGIYRFFSRLFNIGLSGVKYNATNLAIHKSVTLTDLSSTYAYNSASIPNANKMYVRIRYTTISGTPNLSLRFQDTVTTNYQSITPSSYIGTINSASSNKNIGWFATGGTVFMENWTLINLTATFGAGNEPSKEICDLLFADYFEGTKEVQLNDVTQPTANSQPYFVSGALVNPNGGSRFMTHPTVSYTASDNWTVSFILNWNGTINAIAGLIGKGSDTASILSLRLASNNRFSIISEGAATVSGTIGNTNKLIGKDTYVQFKANGTQLQIFIDTVLIETLTANTEIVFSSLIKAYSTASRDFNGSIKYYLNYNGLMTSGQSTAEYTVLRKYFPEIRTTLIGSKNIATENCQMVATPMGRVISLNNTAGNVNGLVTGDFEGGLIGVKADGNGSVSTWTLNTTNPIAGARDGRLIITTTGTSDTSPTLTFFPTRTSGQFRKLSFRHKVNSGTVNLWGFNTGGGVTGAAQLTGIGIYEKYYNCNGTTPLIFYFDGRSLMDVQIDDIKDEIVGWNDAANVYTTIYNQTSGTVTQKTSAALAAAAMWRSPDADHDKQAVFGKEFNKFATKLMAFDIAAYNTANPSTPWGYHVMTRAESLALQALDADTLKATGTDYWTTANGTNTTGLNLLGSGVINADGTYSDFKGKTRLMTDDDYAIDINDDGTSTEISVTTEGGILRLVKD